MGIELPPDRRMLSTFVPIRRLSGCICRWLLSQVIFPHQNSSTVPIGSTIVSHGYEHWYDLFLHLHSYLYLSVLLNDRKSPPKNAAYWYEGLANKVVIGAIVYSKCEVLLSLCDGAYWMKRLVPKILEFSEMKTWGIVHLCCKQRQHQLPQVARELIPGWRLKSEHIIASVN